jgi:hypothetical protein
MPEYILRANNQCIYTDFEGNKSLLDFYNFAKKLSNCTINLNFDGINFFEANLCALLYAMIYHLKLTRNIKVFIDFKTVGRALNVLSRNGFFSHIAGNQFQFKPFDNRDSTIPLSTFSINDADSFCNYIENDFLHQRGLDGIKFTDKEKVKTSYFEIFDNVGIHANTTAPVFVCGQYFPSQSELKLTMVDLGDGFLKKIAAYTKDTDRITTAKDAISWAIRGHSTKVDAKGGTGLKKIFIFCANSGGSFHIVTNDCYYNQTIKSMTNQTITNHFTGTTIHLIFRFLL